MKNGALWVDSEGKLESTGTGIPLDEVRRAVGSERAWAVLDDADHVLVKALPMQPGSVETTMKPVKILYRPDVKIFLMPVDPSWDPNEMPGVKLEVDNIRDGRTRTGSVQKIGDLQVYVQNHGTQDIETVGSRDLPSWLEWQDDRTHYVVRSQRLGSEQLIRFASPLLSGSTD